MNIGDKLRKVRELFEMFDPRALTINENTGDPDLCHVIVFTNLWREFTQLWHEALAEFPDPDAVGGVIEKAKVLHTHCDKSRAYERSDYVSDAMDQFQAALAKLEEK